MGNQIHPEPDQNNTDSKINQCQSKLSEEEGIEPKDNKPHTPNKKEQNASIKLKIPRKFKHIICSPTISDWIIAAATIAISITAYLQWASINLQSTILQKSNDISIATQRAFVNFGTITGTKIVDPIKNRTIAIQLLVVWQNTGTTPTKSATGTSNIQSWRSQLPEGFAYDDVAKVKPIKAVIGAKGIVSQSLSIDVNDLVDAQQRKAHLFSWGSMVYHDIFDRTPPRLTEYCVEITNVKSTKPDPTDPANNFTWDLVQCPTHNCYDENCPDYDKRTKQ